MASIDNKKQSLQDYIQSGKFPIKDFLEIAVSITQDLAEIESKNIIHRDIKPVNIIVNSENKAFIRESAISINATNDNKYNTKLEKIEGNIHYISSEQTGIVNLPIDFRSDLYSLGAVFYEMLTGKPTFSSEHPLDSIHAHLAIVPSAPHEIDSNVQKVLSDIVITLLAKSPDKRYQSVFGLLVDFNKCLKQLIEKKR